MKRTRIVLLGFLACVSAAAAADKAPADADTVKLVEQFVKTPTADLPPAAVPHFLEIDPDTLPKKLQRPYQAKRLELYTLMQLANGKKKGSIRTPEKNCAIPQESKSSDVRLLKMVGYEEITHDEELCVMEKTKCPERDLMCEFSLQIVVTGAGKKKQWKYFLHANDPLMGVVASCRASSGVGGQTNFFGRGGPVCAH